MHETSRAAYIISQSVCAMASIAGMQARNAARINLESRLAYQEKDFLEVIDECGLGTKDVLLYLQGEKS